MLLPNTHQLVMTLTPLSNRLRILHFLLSHLISKTPWGGILLIISFLRLLFLTLTYFPLNLLNRPRCDEALRREPDTLSRSKSVDKGFDRWVDLLVAYWIDVFDIPIVPSIWTDTDRDIPSTRYALLPYLILILLAFDSSWIYALFFRLHWSIRLYLTFTFFCHC
jgi:hypothetical protein